VFVPDVFHEFIKTGIKERERIERRKKETTISIMPKPCSDESGLPNRLSNRPLVSIFHP
jgi:hypothetical protein